MKDDKTDIALLIWCDYYVSTERFDRLVCTGKCDRTGDAMPMNAHQSGEINRNARLAMKVARQEAIQNEVSEGDWKAAQEIALRYTHDGLIELREFLRQKVTLR